MSRTSRLMVCDACGELTYINSPHEDWVYNERFGDLCPDCAEVLLRIFERDSDDKVLEVKADE